MSQSVGPAEDSKLNMNFRPFGIQKQRLQVLPSTCRLRRFYVQICLLAVLVAVLLIARAISNMRVIFVQYHAASDTDGELVVLPEKFASKRGAHCLDGSPPGYYIRTG